MSKHYTAVLDIQEVEHTAPSKNYGETVPGQRNVSDVTKIVVRADSLESLRAKLTAHVALIEN